MNILERAWRSLLARFQGPSYRGDEVIIHDPAAEKPHDLDDPFYDQDVQDKVGQIIAEAKAKAQKPDS